MVFHFYSLKTLLCVRSNVCKMLCGASDSVPNNTMRSKGFFWNEAWLTLCLTRVMVLHQSATRLFKTKQSMQLMRWWSVYIPSWPLDLDLFGFRNHFARFLEEVKVYRIRALWQVFEYAPVKYLISELLFVAFFFFLIQWLSGQSFWNELRMPKMFPCLEQVWRWVQHKTLNVNRRFL